MDQLALSTYFLAGATLVSAIAAIVSAWAAKASRLSADESKEQWELARRSALSAEKQATAASNFATAADTRAIAAKDRVDVAQQALKQTQLEESYRSFRWASNKALNDDATVAVVGIALLGDILASSTPGEPPAPEAEAVAHLALLRSNVTGFLLGLLASRVEDADPGGSGTIKVDATTKAIASALRTQGGLNEAVVARLDAIAKAKVGGNPVPVNQVTLLNQVNRLDEGLGAEMKKRKTISRTLELPGIG